VHLTLGILRTSQAVFYALSFFWLDGFAVPAPAQVTQTVMPLDERLLSQIVTEGSPAMNAIESSSEKRVLSRFETQALEHQKSKMKSPAEAIRQFWKGLAGCVGSIVLFLIIGIAIRLFSGSERSSTPNMAYLLTCPIALFGLVMLVQFVSAGSKLLTRRSGDIVCPKCKTRHNLFIGDKIYWCTNCFTPLHFQAMGKHDMALLACPYCTTEHAVQSDYRGFMCPDCGFPFDIANGRAIESQFPIAACAKCAATIPSMVYYCKSCWHINTTHFAEGYAGYGLDEKRLGKRPTGHYVYALAAYDLLSQETRMPRLVKNSISKSAKFVHGIETILESAEFAVRTIPPAQIGQLLAKLDKPYAIALWTLSEELSRYGNTFVATSPLSELASNELGGYLALHAGIVQLVRADPEAEKTGAIRDWKTPLLKRELVVQTKPATSMIAPPEKYAYTGIEALKEEAKRLYTDVATIPISVADT